MSGQIPLSKVVDFLEKKSRETSKIIKSIESEGTPKEWIQRLKDFNSSIDRSLVTLILEASKESVSRTDLVSLLTPCEKPKTDQAVLGSLRAQIMQDSENPMIRRHAVELAKQVHDRYQFSEPIPPVHRLYAMLEEGKAPKEARMFASHCVHVSKHLYEWVESRIDFVSDPPGDYFQPAPATLMIGGGDCDDVSILVCSLLRSIGFRTFLMLEPQHVFPGVVLARTSAAPIDPEGKIHSAQGVLVPLDPRRRFPIELGEETTVVFDPFEVAFQDGSFKEKSRRIMQGASGIEDSSKRQATDKEVATQLRSMIDWFSSLQTGAYYIDPTAPEPV